MKPVESIASHDLAYLFRRLGQRNARPEEADAIDAQLWHELGVEQAILVGDLTGFTRLTKKRGILHFLALHQQGVQIAEPIVRKHNGAMVKSEADNIIARFPDACDAVQAAVLLQRAIEAHNLQVADPERHLLYCLGIGFGRVLLLSDDLFGDEVNVAYKLGEDIARSGEILVSESAHAAIIARTSQFAFSPPAQADAGNVTLRFYRLA